MSAHLLVLAKFLKVLVYSDFKNSLPSSVSIICILKQTDTGNNDSRMGSWETCGTLGKHACAVNDSRKVLPYLKHFACKGGLSLTLLIGNLLACKQGLWLRKLQISISVHPLTLRVKLREVILQRTA